MQTSYASSPIFVVGYIHTGTSLMKSILKRNPALWPVAGETHFFQDLGKIRREFPDLSGEAAKREYVIFLIKLAYLGNKRAMRHRDEWTLADFGLDEGVVERLMAQTRGTETYEALFLLVADELARLAGRQRWIEKTPEHVYYLPTILRYAPNARVVEMVRDPRATLSSRKLRRTGDEWLDAKEERESLEVDRSTNYDPILDAMMWKEAISAARDTHQTHPQNVLTVRYEDLTRDPAGTVRRICDFSGLTFSEDMLEVGWVNSATLASETGSPRQGQAKTGVSTAAVEKWRKTLSPQEIYVCQTLLRKELRELAYEPAPVGLSDRVTAPFLAAGTAVNLVKRLGNNRPHQNKARAQDALGRIERRILRNLGIQR